MKAELFDSYYDGYVEGIERLLPNPTTYPFLRIEYPVTFIPLQRLNTPTDTSSSNVRKGHTITFRKTLDKGQWKWQRVY